jgi:hypothetical protein
MPIKLGCISDIPNFTSKFPGDVLIGINFKYPFAGTGLYCGVPPIAFDIPSTFNNTIGKLLGNCPGAIGATIHDDDYFIGERQFFQTSGQLILFIVDTDYG